MQLDPIIVKVSFLPIQGNDDVVRVLAVLRNAYTNYYLGELSEVVTLKRLETSAGRLAKTLVLGHVKRQKAAIARQSKPR